VARTLLQMVVGNSQRFHNNTMLEWCVGSRNGEVLMDSIFGSDKGINFRCFQSVKATNNLSEFYIYMYCKAYQQLFVLTVLIANIELYGK